MTVKYRGIPEVPMDLTAHEELRQFLLNMRQAVVDLRGPQSQAGAAMTGPSNLKVTPQSFGNLIQWTRGLHADGTEVLWNSTPSLANAVVVDVGSSQQHVDMVGAANVKRYYWVRSYDHHSKSVTTEVGPISGVTLASGSAVAFPTPPPAGQSLVTDSTTGHTVDRYARQR